MKRANVTAHNPETRTNPDDLFPANINVGATEPGHAVVEPNALK
jgi:hypothetical protein